MGSGCGDSIVEKSFVLRANSPSRWHLTRCLLLCSRLTIHDFTENVNSYFIDISASIQPDTTAFRFCLDSRYSRGDIPILSRKARAK